MSPKRSKDKNSHYQIISGSEVVWPFGKIAYDYICDTDPMFNQRGMVESHCPAFSEKMHRAIILISDQFPDLDGTIANKIESCINRGDHCALIIYLDHTLCSGETSKSFFNLFDYAFSVMTTIDTCAKILKSPKIGDMSDIIASLERVTQRLPTIK